VPCDFIAILSVSGQTVRHLSKYRPSHPIFVITTQPRLMEKTALIWGVGGAVAIEEKDLQTEVGMIDELLTRRRADPDAMILVTGYLGERFSMGKSIRYIRRQDRKKV
jgi:pyruvate kinase